jgi:hypothetical protein
VCTASCHCSTDAEAQAAGFGFCDEARGTCEPTPPYGTCGGTITCNQLPPTCPEGQVPLHDANGCYSGGCVEINLCDVPAGCKAIQHESDCLADATCTSVYAGINCTNPQGQQCVAGQANCTCERFDYSSCTTRITGRQVINTSTGFVDFGSMAQFLSH